MKKDKKTINGQIEIQFQNLISTLPHPTKVTITKVYEDGYADIKTTYGELKHIQTIIPHEVNDETILIFLENDYNQRIII